MEVEIRAAKHKKNPYDDMLTQSKFDERLICPVWAWVVARTLLKLTNKI